jgi:hypothetical protein
MAASPELWAADDVLVLFYRQAVFSVSESKY